jgi:uncharacterized protein DUF5329
VNCPRICVFAAVILVAAGCDSRAPSRQPVAPKSVKLSGLPSELTVKQRSTTVVPGSAESLRVTIDDITRGQVMTSLADKEGRAVLAATSLATGDTVTFELGDETFQLKLEELKNALVGDDVATFTISFPEKKSPISEHAEIEHAKIERLLSAIEAAEGDVFIRNGAEHTAKDAAEHLRTKWKAAGSKIATAEQFIDEIASKSSLSDEPYRVRQADGTEVTAKDYLLNKLPQIDGGN